jgi:hypothetical protein
VRGGRGGFSDEVGDRGLAAAGGAGGAAAADRAGKA